MGDLRALPQTPARVRVSFHRVKEREKEVRREKRDRKKEIIGGK